MEDSDYMKLALEQARIAANRGEVPVGAVVVYEPIDPATRRIMQPAQVIAEASNYREHSNSPSAHAEFLAIEQAAQHLETWRLSDCTLYVTLEPCIMCAGLLHQARIRRCVYGTRDPKAGALGSLYEIHKDERLNHTYAVTSGVLADECAELLRSFFKTRRR